MCGYFQHDAFTTTLAFWSMFQVTWPGLLFFVQLYQVGQSKTTNEAMNFQRQIYSGKAMSIRQRILRSLTEIDSEMAGAGHPLQEESINLLEAGAGAAGEEEDETLFTREEESKPVGFGDHSHHGHSHGHGGHGHGHGPRGGGGGMWNLIVGTARGRRRQNHGDDEASNPFDFGLWQNCLGFWSNNRQGPLRGINWYTFYEAEPSRAPHPTSRRM